MGFGIERFIGSLDIAQMIGGMNLSYICTQGFNTDMESLYSSQAVSAVSTAE